MNEFASTRHQLVNGLYPCASIQWKWDSGAWHGEVNLWADGNTKAGRVFKVKINPCSPIGNIYATVEDFGPGCWSSVLLPLLEVTPRDLVWCGEWAIAELRRHPEWPAEELARKEPS